MARCGETEGLLEAQFSDPGALLVLGVEGGEGEGFDVGVGGGRAGFEEVQGVEVSFVEARAF